MRRAIFAAFRAGLLMPALLPKLCSGTISQNSWPSNPLFERLNVGYSRHAFVSLANILVIAGYSTYLPTVTLLVRTAVHYRHSALLHAPCKHVLETDRNRSEVLFTKSYGRPGS